MTTATGAPVGRITEMVVTTPNNPAYDGITLGVKFNDGRAVLTLRSENRWGYTLEQLHAKFLDMAGYVVEVVGVEPEAEGDEGDQPKRRRANGGK